MDPLSGSFTRSLVSQMPAVARVHPVDRGYAQRPQICSFRPVLSELERFLIVLHWACSGHTNSCTRDFSILGVLGGPWGPKIGLPGPPFGRRAGPQREILTRRGGGPLGTPQYDSLFVLPGRDQVLKTIFNFVLGPPPQGVPGEGPDCHFPTEI